MIQPVEMKSSLPMTIANGVVSNTTVVWEILVASNNGDLDKIKELAGECPELVYAQYNYTPPIHFAVREGHSAIVKFLLDAGALDPSYKIYPFQESLLNFADDRGYEKIKTMLQEYLSDESRVKYKGDNGEIHYGKTEEQEQFQKAVNTLKTKKVREILKIHPEWALDETASWGEGILMMPANRGDQELIEVLMSYGATVPSISKWGRAYYFKNYKIAAFLIENGMNANHMTWHHVTLLHDMAQEGDIKKASLLVDHGADINAIDEEYLSTPLGMASRWGQEKMVEWLLLKGADPNKSGAKWSTPLSWAQKKGHHSIEQLLKSAGAEL